MASYFDNNTILWLDGEYRKASDSSASLYGQSLHYGYAVFEGIRAYKTHDGNTKIFRSKAHFDRLKKSAETLNLPLPYTPEELEAVTYEVLQRNNLQDAYIRPLVFGPDNMSFNPNTESHVLIAVWPQAAFLGDKLLRVMTSSFQRPNPKGFKIEAKAAGHYVNSIMASQEAKTNGYDEALLTDINGFIAEGPGANMFFEKDGKLFTPAPGNILPGITRAAVLDIARELNIPVEQGQYTTEDLKQANSAFFCGTAAEVIGWASIDDYTFPLAWEESKGREIQIAFKNHVRELPIKQQKEQLATA
jgi:branched-chain amino acid aminotransferase